MGDDDKPFACPAVGCGMRFTNEDHLTVHKKKHEMSLNLTATIKNNANNLFVDQTPTPTRFIRNCEEVGLFQDLQNVNPFEEQFRKAVEAAKSGVTIITEHHNGHSDNDTLNTPSVLSAVLDSDLVVSTTTASCDDLSTTTNNANCNSFSHGSGLSSVQPSSTTTDSDDDEITVISTSVSMEMENPTAEQEASAEKNLLLDGRDTVSNVPLVEVPNTSQIIQLCTTSGPEEGTVASTVPQSTAVIGNAGTTVVQLLLKFPDGRSVPVQIPAIPVVQTAPVNTQPTMATSNITSLAKMKLKQALTQNQQTSGSGGSSSSNNMYVMTEAVDMVTNQRQKVESMDSDDSGKHPQLIGKRRRTSEEDPDEKRRRFLERNRAAATRCRLKRKQWIQNLERKADELLSTNVQLQNEISLLRNEVAQLKTMLLAHKDCPVTLQQKALGQLEMSQQVSTITALEEVTTIQITSAEAIASTALTNMAHTVTSEPSHILPVDIIIESDPLDLINSVQENSNNDVDK